MIRSFACKDTEKVWNGSKVRALPQDIQDRALTAKIQSLDRARSERTPIIIQAPMDSPKVWLVEANERGRVILDRMQTDIRERKAEIYKANNQGFSGKFNYPTKNATDLEAIQKVRLEAATKRAKISPDMRSNPYNKEHFKGSKQYSDFSSVFQTTEQTAQEGKRTSKMSAKFNRASKDNRVNGPVPTAPILKPD